jgi:thiamine-monophosphate kinase
MSKIASEDQILSIIDELFPRVHPGLILGRGDDCAEFFSASPLAISSDLFLEHAHFRRSYFTAKEVGHKALAVNLSDLAAAGAYPLGFSLALICPPDLEVEWLQTMFEGMAELAGESGIALTGGDISAGAALGFSITAWGGAKVKAPVSPSQGLFLRRGAWAGDVLFLLSPQNLQECCSLGLARLGLEVLEKYGRAAIQKYPEACAALLTPKPMLEAGQVMSGMILEPAVQDFCVAIKAMDLSDGLRRDLPRLLGGLKQQRAAGAVFNHECSQVEGAVDLGAELTFGVKELHPDLMAYHGDAEQKIISMALSGGDEYALLCACAPDKMDALRNALGSCKNRPFIQILGHVVEKPGIRWQGVDVKDILPGAGFDHFNA